MNFSPLEITNILICTKDATKSSHFALIVDMLHMSVGIGFYYLQKISDTLFETGIT